MFFAAASHTLQYARNNWQLPAIAIATLFIANCIAIVLERFQLSRLKQKYEQLLSVKVDARVPVTVITGFLGAGKTTLLNNILACPGGRRVLVIENEAGDLSIDHSLLQGSTATGVTVLKNGCLCCSSGGRGSELERTLDRLLQLSTDGAAASTQSADTVAHGSRLPFDHVVIELSGAADPAPIVQTFARAGSAGACFQLSSIVAVVDAVNVTRHLGGTTISSGLWRNMSGRTGSPEAFQQVAYADLVLLNKVDTTDAMQIAAASAAVRSVNVAARIIPCTRARVDVEMILVGRTFDSQRAADLLVRDIVDALDVHPLLSYASAAHAAVRLSGRHGADSTAITSVTLDLSGLVVHSRHLLDWVRGVVADNWEGLYRVKGVAWVDDDEGSADASGHGQKGKKRSVKAVPRLFAIQGVHAEVQGAYISPPSVPIMRIEGHDHDHDSHGNKATCGCGSRHSVACGHGGHVHPALVLIGRGLDHATLEASFNVAVRQLSREM